MNDTNYHLLRLAVQTAKEYKTTFTKNNYVFLVDTSGSMSSVFDLVKYSLRNLVEKMSPEDTIALVTYAGSTEVKLSSEQAKNKKSILDAIENLEPGGGTWMADGLKLAYKEALKNHGKGVHSRIILLSDGDGNIGQ